MISDSTTSFPYREYSHQSCLNPPPCCSFFFLWRVFNLFAAWMKPTMTCISSTCFFFFGKSEWMTGVLVSSCMHGGRIMSGTSTCERKWFCTTWSSCSFVGLVLMPTCLAVGNSMLESCAGSKPKIWWTHKFFQAKKKKKRTRLKRLQYLSKVGVPSFAKFTLCS